MKKNNERKRIFGIPTVITALVCVIALCLSAYAWLSESRRLAAVAPLDSPMSIFINAAHREDIQYLDLSEIDMERERSDGTRYNYQDFVFSVQGEEVATFKLQLAYTTNNQLTFEIYEAAEGPQGADSVVYYSPTGTAYYYDPIGSALALRYLNAQAGNKLANSTMHAQTYGTYSNVHLYAEPLYCQTVNSIAVRNRDGVNFHNYFILRVLWSNDKMNDRETDMLYISAKSGA